MFDKLIESEPEGAEFHGRKRYFMVSSVVMGVLFTTAVVYSLYAAEVGLGSDSFAISTMLAPVDLPAAKPDIERPQPVRNVAASDSPVPSRRENMSRVDESTFVPPTTSSVPNESLERPISGKYIIGKMDSGPASYGGPARGVSGGTSDPSHIGLSGDAGREEVKEVAPPPPTKPAPTKTVSGGVVNGRATHLPIPAYPATARAVGASGKVDVQVLIDETGSVVSAKAVSGNPLLRASAETAARRARFSPTFLSKVPVKVTGVIIYNFTR